MLQQFEGKTIEDALAAAARELGPDLQVADARRIREGGLMGFFSKERYEVTAEHGASAPARRSPFDDSPSAAVAAEALRLAEQAAPLPNQPTEQGPSLLDETLRALVQRVELDEDLTPTATEPATSPADPSFADLLARAGFDGPESLIDLVTDAGAATSAPTPTAPSPAPPTSPTPTTTEADLRELIQRVGATAALLRRQAVTGEVHPVPTPPAPAAPAPLSAPTDRTTTSAPTTPAAPAGCAPTSPRWSREALGALGVPDEILRRLPPADPESDLEWLAALGRAISTVLPDAGRTDDTTLTASGTGAIAAVDLLRAGVQGFRPGMIQLPHGTVAATPTELALAVRSLLGH